MIICTMTTASHLFRAKVMAESVKAHHKDAQVVLCLLEKRMIPEVKLASCFDHVMLVDQLQVPDFEKYMFMRRVHEASYALKGHFLKHLLRIYPGEDRLLFLDTDTEVLSPMEEVNQALDHHSVVLTPHELHDAKRSYMLHGIINIGFIAVKRSGETERFLDWWTDRVDRYGFDDNYSRGLFYEQNWLNLAMTYFDVHVLKHPGYNAAYWNLHERGNSIALQNHTFMVGDVPLRFFHYSHVHGDLVSFMNKYITNGSRAMHILRERYILKLKKAGLRRLSRLPWSYDYYANGNAIAPEVRTQYRLREELQMKYPHPFHTSNRILNESKPLTIVMLMSNVPYAYPLPPYNQGGTEKIVYDLTEELVRRGHRVYLYAPAGSKSSAHVIPYPENLREFGIASFVARTMPKGVHLIHDHTFSSVTRYRRWKAPAVCTHHIPINNKVRHPIYVSRRALEVYGSNKGYAVYNGIKPEEYEYSEEKQGYLLFIGRILPNKGVHHAITVAELTGRRLIICGPVKDDVYFNRELKPRIDASPNIEYAGAVGGQRKLELLRHAGCLLFPSVYEEPFGLTMVEAMISGTPVLALRHGAVPEVLNGFPGLICETAEEMARKLQNDPFPSPRELQQYVLDRFTVNHMVNHYLNIYEEVRNRRKLKRTGKWNGRILRASKRKKKLMPKAIKRKGLKMKPLRKKPSIKAPAKGLRRPPLAAGKPAASVSKRRKAI